MSIPIIPTYADLLKKIKELEEELKKRVNRKADEHDNFIRGYWK